MKNVRAAKRYAQGLMAAAEDAKAVDRTAVDLDLIARVMKDSREFRMLLASPVVSAPKKKQVFRELLGPRVGPLTLSFIILLATRGREHLLPEVVEQFRALRDQLLGILNVEVASAVEYAKPQENELHAALEKLTKKKVRVHHTLDAAVRGGLVVRIGDTVLDASVRRQLEILRDRLVTGGSPTQET